MQRTLLKNVLNCFQLTTFAIIILLVDASHSKIHSKNATTCAKLKQLAQGMTRQSTYEGFQWIGILSFIQLALGGGGIYPVYLFFFFWFYTCSTLKPDLIDIEKGKKR
jgi:uncharacterized membrane protein